ncbi:translation initiation factor eIF-2B subunit gamma-like isoform X2 [Physella acuta]|uniref:translation initiation factor eIF-2B subunit gamma-like isoform X2 n=1 Tax=Physella acuta TaxID=109671 RepID=UPI0027DC1508|nr:translation initiation factor eIF-2B subunit gamma-like isoform X2 [Physella acuta]
MSNPGECTVVIMAAGTGSRMTDLTNQCPKPLLPMGQFPMIWYPIRTLEKAGFLDIIIITRQSWQEQMHNAIFVDSVPLKAHIEFIVIPDSDESGTADSLRLVADKIKTHVMVVSSDFISDCDLSEMLAVHRKHSSSLTVMLSQLPTSIIAETQVPGSKSKQKNSSEKISIGFESGNTDHILFWKSEIDMENFSFTKKFLTRFPSINLQSTWTDCHVYIINKFVIKYLQDKEDINSLQGELIPMVVKKQMSMYTKGSPNEDQDLNGTDQDLKSEEKKDLIDYAVKFENNLISPVRYLSLNSDSFGMNENTPHKDLIRCYAYRQTSGFCVRANNIVSYFEACKQMPRLISQFITKKRLDSVSTVHDSASKKPKPQVGADCLLGESVTVGEKVTISKSVIGKHCKIGDKVKITNSVIMGHVNIQESSSITNCIIAESVIIGDKCELNNCIVGQNQNISNMSKLNNEVICSGSQMEVPLE